MEKKTSANLQLDTAVYWFEGNTLLVTPGPCCFGVSGNPSAEFYQLQLWSFVGRNYLGVNLHHSLKVVQVLVNVAEPTQNADPWAVGLCSHGFQGWDKHALRGVHLL